MSLISFINKETFEVKDELDDYIYCDYEIRYIIANLNKKGYKTCFSCAGHNDTGLLEPTFREEIKYLDEYLNEIKNDKSVNFIVNKDENYFYCKRERISTHIYIFFDKDYKFNNYPKDFIYEIIDGKSYLSKKIFFYKDKNNSIRKTDIEIYDELDKSHKDLEDWINGLKDIDNE